MVALLFRIGLSADAGQLLKYGSLSDGQELKQQIVYALQDPTVQPLLREIWQDEFAEHQKMKESKLHPTKKQLMASVLKNQFVMQIFEVMTKTPELFDEAVNDIMIALSLEQQRLSATLKKTLQWKAIQQENSQMYLQDMAMDAAAMQESMQTIADELSRKEHALTGDIQKHKDHMSDLDALRLTMKTKMKEGCVCSMGKKLGYSLLTGVATFSTAAGIAMIPGVGQAAALGTVLSAAEAGIAGITGGGALLGTALGMNHVMCSC